MWITGFDKLMPEGRSSPFKYFPRLGTRLSVTFGNPLPADEVRNTIERIFKEYGHDGKDIEARIRTEITAITRRAVEALGRSVSGDSLGMTR